jgi:hypothetical protein
MAHPLVDPSAPAKPTTRGDSTHSSSLRVSVRCGRALRDNGGDHRDLPQLPKAGRDSNAMVRPRRRFTSGPRPEEGRA